MSRPSRRTRNKIEFVPRAREIEHTGGRDLGPFEDDSLPMRRPMRELQDWGNVSVDHLALSIRSQLSTELAYALTTITFFSTMRGDTPNQGFPIGQCYELLDDMLDVLEDRAFGGAEDDFSAKDYVMATHKELTTAHVDAENETFASLHPRQGSKYPDVGPLQRPGNTVLAITNILRNLALIPDNHQFLVKQERMFDILLRLCSVTRKDGTLVASSHILSLIDLITVRRDVLSTLMHLCSPNTPAHTQGIVLSDASSQVVLRIAYRAFHLLASFIVDPKEAVSPLSWIQVGGSVNRPPLAADIALETFTRLAQEDPTRKVLSQIIPPASIRRFFTACLHRLPVADQDFQILAREGWLGYTEKIIMTIYELAFIAPPSLKRSLKADRNLGFRSVMLRLVQKFLTIPAVEMRAHFSIAVRRAVEAMKVLDDGEDLFDTSEVTVTTLSFGMGYGEGAESNHERGTGLLGGHRELTWELLMQRDVLRDVVLFNELESYYVARVRKLTSLSLSAPTIMTDPAPPPIYSQQDGSDTSSASDVSLDPQILIISSSDTMNFQKGYLGADDERAAIEGEIQIKGAESTLSLRSLETAYDRQIELGFAQVVLYTSVDDSPLPSSLLFAIPLMEDAPQSLRTPHSSITHTLTATLDPLDASLSPISEALVVHTKRYTSHSHSLDPSPETHTLTEPTRVQVQVPRTTFIAGEIVPLYVTIPPPPRALVVDQGLRLRNVRIELLRIVQVTGNDEYEADSSGPSTATTPPAQSSSSSKAPASPVSSYQTVIARSGASCRFHSSRPVKLRFLLHQPAPSESPLDAHSSLPTEFGLMESDAECASITQLTLLHSVTFQLNIHTSFVDMSSHTERVSTISIPVIILAPPAPLPEVAPSMDAAYSKKHDRPPARTVRYEDSDHSAPRYSLGEAGPSAAPPPFEERDAPPPFFPSAAEASSSSRLPTFLESENEFIMPPSDNHSTLPPTDPTVVGEGTQFGFSAGEQFDGHSEDMQRSSTPPPTMEMASTVHESEQATGEANDLPPPPPALDDPSDPPPSIDSEFRSPDHPPSPPSEPPPSSPVPQAAELRPADVHAPPPYLIPEQHATPPPYVD
ncbi:ARID domain-containing protein [Mycena indigotica]|uniref:ARID domain-containing protein n=1 Tax=Mycena indigotica TaxID=2126181 RepID=A0A8H6SWU4_9AGAR|nr:ARID domain-containing protein [Mycena indigotica]KAF7306743.1 ARID domain-containing protein [Mycena indigotica]